MAERFEDLRAWQTARSLTNGIYTVTGKGAFDNDWALKDQIRRAAISVLSNIAPQEYFLPRKRGRGAEGFESRTRPQFIDYLGTAKASAGEVRSQLYVANDQGYLDDSELEKLSDLADKTSRQVYNLIRYLNGTDNSSGVRELPGEYVAK